MDLIDLSATDNPISFMGKPSDQQRFEQTIYSKAAALCQSYLGGSWRYVGCGRNIVFMAPKSGDTPDVFNSSGTLIQLTSDAFGLLVTLHGMQALQVDPKYPFLVSRTEKLSAFVEKHAEAEKVFSCFRVSYGCNE